MRNKKIQSDNYAVTIMGDNGEIHERFRTFSDFANSISPGLGDEIEAEHKKMKKEFLAKMKPRTLRPSNLRTILIDVGGRKFPVQWRADFSKKQLLIITKYLSPMVLIELFLALPNADDNFAAAGVSSAEQINNQFTTRICYEYRKLERWFVPRVVNEDGCIGVEITDLEDDNLFIE